MIIFNLRRISQLEDKGLEFLGHIQGLYCAIHVASIAQVHEASVPITYLVRIDIELLLNGCISEYLGFEERVHLLDPALSTQIRIHPNQICQKLI